ncbi:hypothetical protein ACFFWC_16825 [Plantactinospora siamensis]|uniref:EccD-like transmembrane domain-containing protein n=1 Tax=Plantactinospora siamensis TaxID=555372 RepID=A0ABV6NV62_9ACTN
MERLLLILLTAAIRLLPRRRRELAGALLAEAPQVPPGRRRSRWLAGGLWYVGKETVRHRLAYGLGLALAAVALVVVDRLGTSDDAGQVSLLVLLVTAAGSGFAAPRRAWIAGLVIGSALPVLYVALAVLRPQTAHLPEPRGVAGAASLFVLVVPAMIAAGLGAGARILLRGDGPAAD